MDRHDSSEHAKSWEDYHFQNESESHGGSRPPSGVSVSHSFLDMLNRRNEVVQDDESTPNKRSRTHYGDPQFLNMEPHQISSMQFNQQWSIARVSDHNNNTNYNNNRRHASNHSDDEDIPFINIDMGAPPWSMGLGDETVCLPPCDRTKANGAPPTATSNLVATRPFLQSITYLDPDPLAPPPELLFYQGASQLSDHVGSVVDTTSAMNHRAPPDHASFMHMGNDLVAVERSSEEIFSGIDFMSLADHCAPKPIDHSCEHPAPQHVLGAQPDYALGQAITLPFPHHPVLNDDERQTVAHPFARVAHQTPANTTAGPPANMVAGVLQGMTPQLHMNTPQVDYSDFQQMVLLSTQHVAKFHCSPNAMPIMMIVDQSTPSTGTDLPMLGGPPSPPESSQVGQHQQQNIAVVAPDEKVSSQTPPGIPLSLQCDGTRLSGYQTLIRRQLEFFVADSEDVQSGGQGRKKKLSLGQVGIRCIHCRHLPWTRRGHAAIYFPSTLEGVYQAAQNMAANHLCGSCHCIPVTLQAELRCLRKGTVPRNPRNGKFYWAEACRTIGLVETTKNGLKLKRGGSNKKQTPRKDVVVPKSPPKQG